MHLDFSGEMDLEGLWDCAGSVFDDFSPFGMGGAIRPVNREISRQ